MIKIKGETGSLCGVLKQCLWEHSTGPKGGEHKRAAIGLPNHKALKEKETITKKKEENSKLDDSDQIEGFVPPPFSRVRVR